MEKENEETWGTDRMETGGSKDLKQKRDMGTKPTSCVPTRESVNPKYSSTS